MIEKIMFVLLILGAAIGVLGAPKVNFVFENWLSFIIILVIVVGTVVWITYVAWSIKKLRRETRDIVEDMRRMMTKKEFEDEFEKFKKEIRGDE